MSRYASSTSVPMERSRLEVERTLQRYGATGFAYAWEHRTEAVPHPKSCLCKGTRYYCPRDFYGKDAAPGQAPCPRAPTARTIERQVVAVEFKMKAGDAERRIRLEVPMPHESEAGTKAKAEAATRQRWRALVLVLKAKLEAVASGISTLEAEFLANVVMADGRTLGAAILPRLTEAAATGRLLPAAGEDGHA